MAAAKKRPPSKILDSLRRRARVISVYGPFNHRALIDVPADLAVEILRKPLEHAGPTSVIESVERDLEGIRKRAPDVADSSLGATALRLAYELENPFNSATSKSMCARSLIEAMNRLYEQAPPEEEGDELDELAAKRAARRDAAAKG